MLCHVGRKRWRVGDNHTWSCVVLVGGGGGVVGGGGVRHAVVLGAGYVQAPGSLTERS